MAQLTALAPTTAGVTPAPVQPTASDTIAEADVGTRGAFLRVITTGTATDVTVVDPRPTPLGNTVATPPVVSVPATGVRVIYIAPAAVNPATGFATVNFSGTRTGVTVELYRL